MCQKAGDDDRQTQHTNEQKAIFSDTEEEYNNTVFCPVGRNQVKVPSCFYAVGSKVVGSVGTHSFLYINNETTTSCPIFNFIINITTPFIVVGPHADHLQLL